MTISSNYATMQAQIADELGDKTELLEPLGDSGLSQSPIVNAIQEAIAKWERVPFYFNELIDTNGFSTAQGQEFYGANTSPSAYAAIATYARVLTLHILIGNNRYVFYPRTVQYLDAVSVNPSVNGEPIDISIFAEQFRFYPIPSSAWPVTVLGTQRFTALAKGTDANVWTQDAEPLIRNEAKLIIGRDVIRNPGVVKAAQLAIYGDPSDPEIKGCLYDLRAEGIRRKRKGKIRPTHF